MKSIFQAIPIFFSKQVSYKKNVILSIISNIFSKALLFITTLIIGRYFIGSQTDNYFYVFSIITIIAAFLNNSDVSVLSPEAMQIRNNVGKEQENSFWNTFLFLHGISMFILIIGYFISFFFFNVSNEYGLEAIILIFLVVFTSFLSTILTTYNYFSIPSLVSTLANICALLCIIFLSSRFTLRVSFWGMIIGYSIALIYLINILISSENWIFTFGYNNLRMLKSCLRKIFLVQLGSLATLIYSYGLITILKNLGVGVLSAYTYSQQIVGIPLNLFVVQLSAVVGIRLNSLIAKGNIKEADDEVLKNVSLLLFIVVPICFVVSIFADDIINLLFWNKKVNEGEFLQASFFLKYLIWILPFSLINTFLARLFFAFKKVDISFLNQLFFNIGLIVILKYLATLENYKIIVYTILAFHYFFILVVAYLVCRKVIPQIKYIRLITTFMNIVLINLVPALIIFVLKEFLLISIIKYGLIVMLFIYLIYLLNYFLKTYIKINLF